MLLWSSGLWKCSTYHCIEDIKGQRWGDLGWQAAPESDAGRVDGVLEDADTAKGSKESVGMTSSMGTDWSEQRCSLMIDDPVQHAWQLSVVGVMLRVVVPNPRLRSFLIHCLCVGNCCDRILLHVVVRLLNLSSLFSKWFNKWLHTCIIWAPSSEFVSSSIPSWQISTAHVQPFRGARDLVFCLKVPLDSLLVWASSEGSGETARMRRLAWTFAARIGDKNQIRLTRSICSKSLEHTPASSFLQGDRTSSFLKTGDILALILPGGNSPLSTEAWQHKTQEQTVQHTV